MAIPRNKKCHCGSGKKYKNCCMNADNALKENPASFFQGINDKPKKIADFLDAGMIDLMNNFFEADGSDANFDDIFDISMQRRFPEIPLKYQKVNYNTPKPNNAEAKQISEFEDFIIADPPIEELYRHITNFLDKHPKLIKFTEFEKEVIDNFEFEAVQNGMNTEYISLLHRFRKDFTANYLRNFGELDNKIIYNLLRSGKSTEIEQYFNFYLQYPADGFFSAYNLVNVLYSINQVELGLKLVEKIYEPNCVDEDPEFTGTLLMNLIHNYALQLCKPEYTDADIDKILAYSETLKIIPEQEYLSYEYWIDFFDEILTEPTFNSNDNNDPEDAIFEITNLHHNFILYLKNEKNIEWLTAWHFAKGVDKYFFNLHTLSYDKDLGGILNFDKNVLEDIFVTIDDYDNFSNEITKYQILSGLYYFADYLISIKLIDKNTCANLQLYCTDIHKEEFIENANSFLALLYQKFPMF